MSVSIPYIKQEFSICSKLVLSIIPNCHLLPYSFTAILLPNLVDRFGGRKSLTITFGGAGISIACIFLTRFLPQENKIPSLAFVCFCIFCGGFFQAFGWPSAMKSLAENIPPKLRDAVLPIWTTCCFVGSSVGGILLGAILMMQKNRFRENGFCENVWNGTECGKHQFFEKTISNCEIPNILKFQNINGTEVRHMNWGLAYVFPAMAPILMAFVTFFTMPEPVDTSENVDAEHDNFKGRDPESRLTPESPKISIFQIVDEIPGVLWLALAYACAKGSRYWFFYWCIDWLVEESNGAFSPAVATYLSTAIDIGTILGLLLVGPLTTENWFTKTILRKPVPSLYCAALSISSAIPMIYFARLAVQTNDVYIVFGVLIILGALVALSDPIYSGTAACEASDIDGRNLHGSVSGFINGTGSFGALLLNPIASYLGDLDYKYALVTVSVTLAMGTVLTFCAHMSLERAKRREFNSVPDGVRINRSISYG